MKKKKKKKKKKTKNKYKKVKLLKNIINLYFNFFIKFNNIFKLK